MSGPADIMAAVARKYDIAQQSANSEDRLRQAQATGITGALDSENALRNAQAYETAQRGQTIGPTAQASIASTMAGIPETQARTGYMTAQTRTLNDMTAPGGEPLARWWLGQLPPGTVRPDPVPAASGGASTRSLAAPTPDVTSRGVSMDPFDNRWGAGSYHFAGGSADVPAPGQTITGGSWEGPQPTPAPAPLPPSPSTGSELRRRLGLGVVRAYASGSADVPGPGQTITGGSWEGPQPMPAPAPLPPSPTTGTDLRRRLGLGAVRAFADGTSDVTTIDMPGGAFNHSDDTGAGGAGVIMAPGDMAPGARAGTLGGSGFGGGAGGGGGAGVGHPGAQITEIAPGSMQPGAYSHDGRLHFSNEPDFQAHARGTGRVQPKGGGAPAPSRSMRAPAPGGPPPMAMPSGPGGPAAPGSAPGGPGAMPSLMQALQAAMGAPQVPGQRPPLGQPQDTVPAMLTPGEAVLTPGAAQAVGRGNIQHMNAQHPPAGPAGAPGQRPAPQPGRGMPTKKPGGKDGKHVAIHIHMH